MSAISNIEAASPATSLVVEENKAASEQTAPAQATSNQAISRNSDALQKVVAETTLHPQLQEIHDAAAKKAEVSGKRHYAVLYKFYSKEIRQLDPEFLKKNPELIFRRALAGLERGIGKKNVVRKYQEYISEARNDYYFVAEHAEKGSRLAEVATKRLKLMEEMLSCQPATKKEWEKTIKKLTDDYLRSWLANSQSQHSELTGRELRKQVFQVLQNSDELQRTFIDEFIKIFETQPEVVLGRAECTERKIKLHKGRKDQLALLVQVGYEWPKNSLFANYRI